MGLELEAILTRIKEVKKTLEQTDNAELARQLEGVNDSLRILSGNQSEFADAVFKALGNIESKMMEGFKMMEAKVAELDAKIRPSREVSPCTPSPTSSRKKRKIARHPDLSVSKTYSYLSKHCIFFKVFMKLDHFDLFVLKKKKKSFGSPSLSRNFKLRAATGNFSHF